MKKIWYTACFLFACAAIGQAQTVQEEVQDDLDDKIQQEPPRDAQRRLEAVTAPSTANQQNARAQADAEEKRKREIERATGQPAENPAKKNTVVPKAQLNVPDSKPLRSE